jgi:hypothetical protein
MEAPKRRGRGRQLGDGVISEGVRLALRAAYVSGIEVSLAAAKKFGQPGAQALGVLEAEVDNEARNAREGVSNE